MGKPKQRPLFIIVDGGDGSGKDTQAKAIAKYLMSQNNSHIRIRSHPALDNRFGRRAKTALKTEGKKGHLLAAFFYTLDVIRSLIKYYRHEEEVIIFSRYLLGVCYLPRNLVMFGYTLFSHMLPTSYYSFYLDVDPLISRERISRRGGVVEMFETLPKLRKMQQKMKHVTKFHHWHRIDGNGTPSQVWSQIKVILE
ncbi:MAG: thymidylate kinase [Candidatus Hodarchaeales archaeon]|jgi:dTMP kinase